MTSNTTTSLFFESFLIEKKISYQTQSLNNLTVFIIELIVKHGKFSGTKVTVGLPIPQDFEVTAVHAFFGTLGS